MLGPPDMIFIPYKKNTFKVDKFDDLQMEFIFENNEVSGLNYKDISGVYECKKIK